MHPSKKGRKKLKKVERFFGEDVTAKITVTVEKNVQTVEITLIKDGMIFRAEEKAEHMNEVFDLCVMFLFVDTKEQDKAGKALQSGRS